MAIPIERVSRSPHPADSNRNRGLPRRRSGRAEKLSATVRSDLVLQNQVVKRVRSIAVLIGCGRGDGGPADVAFAGHTPGRDPRRRRGDKNYPR